MDAPQRKPPRAGKEHRAGRGAASIDLWKGKSNEAGNTNSTPIQNDNQLLRRPPDLAGWYRAAVASDAYQNPPKRHRGKP